MSKETLKFRPNEPEEQIKWQEEIAKKFGIEHDAEFWKVRLKLKDGREITEYVPKHSGPPSRKDPETGEEVTDWSKMFVKDLGWVDRTEVIEAIQKIYPKMEKPNMKEAILELKKSKQQP